jgi:methyl-accepting chemotaxis protein
MSKLLKLKWSFNNQSSQTSLLDNNGLNHEVLNIDEKETGVDTQLVEFHGDTNNEINNELNNETGKESLALKMEELLELFLFLSSEMEQSIELINQIAFDFSEMMYGVDNQAEIIKGYAELGSQMKDQIVTVINTIDLTHGHIQSTKLETQQGNQVVNDAVSQMAKLHESTNNVIEAINELVEGSEQIGAITTTIKEISDQTNLLALNASIEAARAGKEGAGFAVIAQEIRKLSEETHKAANQISVLISTNKKDIHNVNNALNTTINDMKDSIDLVNSAGSSFKNISTLIARVWEESEEVIKSTQLLENETISIQASMDQVVATSNNIEQEAQIIFGNIQQQVVSSDQIESNNAKILEKINEMKVVIGS